MTGHSWQLQVSVINLSDSDLDELFIKKIFNIFQCLIQCITFISMLVSYFAFYHDEYIVTQDLHVWLVNTYVADTLSLSLSLSTCGEHILCFVHN